jgi:hypothetical protein
VTENDPILAKVRKLLALAEDPSATPHEASTYTAKAADLIAAYGIDQALLAASDPAADPVGDRVIGLDAPYAADKCDLLSTIAICLRCRCVRRTGYSARGKELSVHLFGHASDLERTEILFTSLLLQSASGLFRTPVPAFEHAAAFRRSWLAGFTSAVGRRLAAAEMQAAEAAEERFRAPGRTSALVLADRSVAVDAAMSDAYPSLSTTRPRSLSGSGGAHGRAAGQRADLGGRRVRAGGPARLDVH